jgi:dTMP kinase
MGVLVAIEGIDGAGKGTQATQLTETARSEGYSTRCFSFPLYDGNPFSEAISAYLNGAFGGVDEVHPELAGLLYACDRYHARASLVAALETCDLVVCDRYVPSNLAHQGAKLSGPARGELLDWLAQVEYVEFDLPRPSLVILLDLPSEIAQARVARKAPRGYTALGHDIHEGSRDYLEATREIFLNLAAGDGDGWLTVSLVDGPDGVSDVNQVARQIWDTVSSLLPG